MSFTILPAIDVRDRRVVRLHQGDYARETRYTDDPFALAMRYADAGAQWLHLVDLDAAREGGFTLSPLLARITADGRLKVQAGGGIRGAEDVDRLLDAGVSRVVVGSMAVTQPAVVSGLLERLGAQALTVAFDVRQGGDGTWRPATHGWTRLADVTLRDALQPQVDAGLVHVLCTDIARDGMLSGPNFDLYAQVLAWAPTLQVQASGGTHALDDVARARDAGCAGIVLGKALLEGRVHLREALAC